MNRTAAIILYRRQAIRIPKELRRMANFQVDVIISSLKELQKEKAQNEKILAEEYGRRKQIEAKLEAATAKYAAASGKNAKMRETMNVAEQKVAQSQALVKMSEELNGEKRQRIAELNQKIAAAEGAKQTDVFEFEAKMAALTDQFRIARHQYSDSSLESDIAHCEQQKAALSAQVSANECQLHGLNVKVEQLLSERNSSSDTAEQITEDTWKAVLPMFEDENKGSKAALRSSELKLQALQEQHSRLATKLEELEGMQTGTREE